MEEVMQQSKMK